MANQSVTNEARRDSTEQPQPVGESSEDIETLRRPVWKAWDNYSGVARIDENHAKFLTALVACNKPSRILEVGFGSGEAVKAIMAGLRYNATEFDYSSVDSWMDFGGFVPPITKQDHFADI